MRINALPRLVVCALLTGAMPSSLSAVITLDADFDHGSLDEANSSVVGNTVLLAGRDNYNTGTWKWIHFKASGVNGLTPTFDIDNDFASGSSKLNNHEMVYSYDQENWFFFDNNQHFSSLGRYNFSNNTAFTQDDVWSTTSTRSRPAPGSPPPPAPTPTSSSPNHPAASMTWAG